MTKDMGAGQAALSSGSPGPVQDEHQYWALVRRRIETQKHYPRRALMRGLEGTVQIRFTLNQDGTLAELSVRNGSSHPSLDDAALSAVRAAAPFPPLPESVAANRPLELNIDFIPR